MTTSSTPGPSSQSRTRKRSRSDRPGTVTRTAILDYLRKRLRWLSPLTPNMLNTSSPASYSSQNPSKLRTWSKRTATPSAPITTVSAMPPNVANRNTPHASIARFIILGRLTAARTQPAPREDTLNPSAPATQSHPPTTPTVAATMMPFPKNARPSPSHPHPRNLRPTLMATQPLPSTAKKMWKWTGMARQHPLLPRPLGPTLST